MLEIHPDPIPKGIAKWKATVLVDDEGIIYVPACIAPCGEESALMSAAWDGESIASHRNHAFVRISWLIREYPSIREDMVAMRDSIRRRKFSEQNPNLKIEDGSEDDLDDV